MTISRSGHNLMFVISQPRSGSTLLQKMLGAHSTIQTSVEPWLLLPLMYALKEKGIRAEYNEYNVNLDTLAFLDAVPGGRERYMDGIRDMAGGIYNAAMEDGKRYFLDKTPRYYLIIPELAELFPEAKFILLFRNPLSVLASMQSTWRSVFGLLHSSLRMDLLKAPDLLIAGQKLLGDRARCIHYESLVTCPEEELGRICEWLSIPFEPSMVVYGGMGKEKWALGDQGTIYEHDRPVTGRIDRWLGYVQSAQGWRYARSYLDFLGPDRLQLLGYPAGELARKLESLRPPLYRRLFTLPFLFSMSTHNVLRRIYRRLLFKEAIF